MPKISIRSPNVERNNAYQTGAGINLKKKSTQKQINSGLLGTLASTGIPIAAIELVLKLSGKGLRTPPLKTQKRKGRPFNPKREKVYKNQKE